MNRRDFFKFFAGAAAVATAAVVLPEEIAELLAPRRAIFLPPRQTLQTFIPQLWANEIVERYKQNLIVSSFIAKNCRPADGVLILPNRPIQIYPRKGLEWRG